MNAGRWNWPLQSENKLNTGNYVRTVFLSPPLRNFVFPHAILQICYHCYICLLWLKKNCQNWTPVLNLSYATSQMLALWVKQGKCYPKMGKYSPSIVISFKIKITNTFQPEAVQLSTIALFKGVWSAWVHFLEMNRIPRDALGGARVNTLKF